MRNEWVGLDQNEIEKDRKRRATTDKPEHTISVYFSKLTEFLKKAFEGVQAAFQIMMDRAVEDLEGGKGSKYLEIAKDRLENRLKDLIEPREEKKRVTEVDVEVTRSEFKKGGGRHLDYFLKGKDARKRSTKFYFYDEEMSEFLASEKEMSFGRIFVIRMLQIKVLESLYGLEKDKGGKITDEAKENAEVIAKMGTMQLKSDDDWQEFLLKKFEARRTKEGNNEKALTSVIKFLETFLQAFTTHTPYNIDDFGDNLLTKTFPRAMTGQLIHDCGVYALRIAYMLSLIRYHKDLRLQFKFIVLPNHVGLIITGKDLPLYIAHNDKITVYSSEDVKEWKEEWVKVDEKGQVRAPTGKENEDKFVAELAAHHFIPGTDVPFALLEVPETRGKKADTKKKLWSYYTKKVATTELFGPETFKPESPHYQFHLRYLEVLKMMKEHHNKVLLPFWNGIAFNAWKKQGSKLHAALQKMKLAKVGKDKEEATKAYNVIISLYDAMVDKEFNKVKKEFEPIRDKQLEIATYLIENPKVIRKGISLASSERLAIIFKPPEWERDFLKHIWELNVNKVDIDPPFAKEEDLLEPID